MGPGSSRWPSLVHVTILGEPLKESVTTLISWESVAEEAGLGDQGMGYPPRPLQLPLPPLHLTPYLPAELLVPSSQQAIPCPQDSAPAVCCLEPT